MKIKSTLSFQCYKLQFSQSRQNLTQARVIAKVSLITVWLSDCGITSGGLESEQNICVLAALQLWYEQIDI